MLAKLRSSGPDEALWPDKSILDQWAKGSEQVGIRFYDEMAALLAKSYARGELSFDEGDDIANHLWGLMITRDAGWSGLLYEVYEAFDDGEWSHFGKWHTSQPVADYTDPAIKEIVARLKQSE